MKAGAILGLILTAVLSWPADAAPLPVPVTIEQLLANPDHYAMKDVRITGQVDNCISFTCNLCPADMTRETLDLKKCIGMSFTGYRPEGEGMAQDVAASRTETGMENLFRFATVTLDAFFNPACLTNKAYNRDGSVQVDARNIVLTVVCTDRATVLEDARVIDLHARKSARDGLVSYYDFGPLVEADAAMAGEIRAVWADRLKDVKANDLKVFLLPASPYGDDKAIDRDALVCECRIDDCSGKWPTRYFGGFDTPGNPFACNEVYRRNGVWVVAAEP